LSAVLVNDHIKGCDTRAAAKASCAKASVSP